MMSTNYVKLKTNLRLCIQRLKMIEKKKTELAQKSRKEIGEYLLTNKLERAKIRVEHIIREDYLVEAMELVEMYCDILITRFGLIQQMKTLDDGLAEAISSLLWVAPRLQSDISEMKIVSDLLTQKYGKQYVQAAREGNLTTISKKLKSKMAIEAPPRILVEKYLIEIAKALNIDYEPDESILSEEEKKNNQTDTNNLLIDFDNDNVFGGPIPSISSKSLDPISKDENIVRPIGFDLQNSSKELESLKPNETNQYQRISPPPNYDSLMLNNRESNNKYVETPKNLPNTLPFEDQTNQPFTSTKDEIDFDDLAKRFEALKNKK